MDRKNNIKITASEMASLWDVYINQSHNICILKYFIAKAEDPDAQIILNKAYNIIERLMVEAKQILENENVPVPTGFTPEQDVNEDAHRLFSDSFSLLFIKNLARVKVSACGLMYTMSTRKDIREYFKKCLQEGTVIFDEVSDVLLEKGLYVRPPIIEEPKEADLVENKDYLNGSNFLRDLRYLNAVEISHIFGNIEANVIGSILTKGYGQTADLKEIRDFMNKSGKLAEEIINSLTSFLTESNLPAPMASDLQICSSSQPPFSDKLMMYQISMLTAAGISDYATSTATSLRNDLIRYYMDLITETSKLAKQAINLMITNHWLEQPPQQDKISFGGV